MTKRAQDVIVYRGNTALVSITLTTADRSPIDTTDPDLGLKWRLAGTFASDNDLVLKELITGGITLTPDGVASIALSSAETDFDPGVYYHEMTITNGGDVDTALTGALVIKPARR